MLTDILEIFQVEDKNIFYFERLKDGSDKPFIKKTLQNKIGIIVLKNKVLIEEPILDSVIEVARDFYNTVEIIENIEDDTKPVNATHEEKWLKLFVYMDIQSLSVLKKELAKRYHPDACRTNSNEDMAIINGLLDDLIGASHA